MRLWAFCILLFCSSQSLLAQGIAGFIPSSRTIDWMHVGIPGGIPSASWPVCTTISPSGGSDDSVTIQTAINNCSADSVIQLSTGTFKIHRSSVVCYGLPDDYAYGSFEAGLCLDKAVVLRGAGPNNTVLQYGDGANVISLGRAYLSSSQVVFTPVTSAAPKGATSITLQQTIGITAGTYLVITETNPTDTDGSALVNTGGYTGSCSGCGHNLYNNVMSQIDRVTALSGNTVTLERPLYFNYSNSPQVYKLSMVENAGLEDVRLQPTASSGTGIIFKNVNLESCAHCWVHNVESDMAVDRSHIYLSDVYASEISNNYLNDGYSHNSGETYSIFLEFRASENLIQNNIIRKARHAMIVSGTSGNVFAYNYDIDSYMGEYPNSLAGDNGHGAHPYMNLYEGNVTSNFEFDFAHGSSSHNTLFRNYVNLTSTNPTTGKPMTSGLFAVADAYYNNYENVIGNVLGEYGNSCTASTYEINANQSQYASIYKLGYYDDGGTSSPNSTLSAKVGRTIVRGGNWDCTTNATVWSNNVPSGSLVSTYLNPQTLPNSLYVASKPSWFGNTAWPPIDPAANIRVNKIPAQVCYENGPKLGLPFAPSSCYAGASQQAPQPPTGLSATVN